MYKPPKILKKLSESELNEILTNHQLENLNYGNKKNKLVFNNRDLSGISLENIDLSEAIFNSSDLTNVAFKGSNLSGGKFKNVNLNKANLKEADLSRTDFINATFIEANLEKTDFSWVRLTHGDFTSANLSESNISKGDFDFAIFKYTNFTKTIIYDTKFTNTKFTSLFFRKTILTKINLENSELIDVRLVDIDITKSRFNEMNLKNIDFTGSNLSEATFTKTNLIEINLSEANLTNANFSMTRLKKANLTDTQLNKAVLSKTDISGCDFLRSNLKNTNCSYAIVDGETSFIDCHINHKTNFTGVGLSSARLEPGLKLLLEYNIRQARFEKWYKENSWWKSIPAKWFWALSDYGMSTGKIIKSFLLLSVLFSIIYLLPGFCPCPSTDPAFNPASCDCTFTPPYAWTDYYAVSSPCEGRGLIKNLLYDESTRKPFPPGTAACRSLYFSVVTMTTLGFGDMHAMPGSLIGYLVLSIQVILGYVLLGALITRLAILFTSDGPAKVFSKKSNDKQP